MFWKGAFPGIAFELEPGLLGDEVTFDKEQFDKMVGEYESGLTRALRLVGIRARSLAPQVADPVGHIKVQKEAIAANKGVPIRIFLGSEEAKLASSQDKLTWNLRLGRRVKRFLNNQLMRNFIDRMIAIGVLAPPVSKRYQVDWEDLNTVTDEDKSNLALKRTQATAEYVSSGMIHLVGPMDFFTIYMGMRPADAKKITESPEFKEGVETLKKVDPSKKGGPPPGGPGDKQKFSAGESDSQTADRQAQNF
jgi:hypothetical protein